MNGNKFKRILSLILIACMCFTAAISLSTVKAEAKTVRLSAKSVMVAMGGKQKITLKGGKGTWTIKNNGVARLSSKKKTSVVVVPKKAGTTYVYCKVGKKTLKCKVRVLNNSVGAAEDYRFSTTILGKKLSFEFNLPRGVSITDVSYNTKRGTVKTTSTVNEDTGVTTVKITVKASKAGRFPVSISYSDGAVDKPYFPFIKGFRGKTKVKKTSANYKKWRRQVITSLVDKNMTTWEIVDALGYLINSGKYGYKGGTDGMQLWYGGNGTCVSGAKMMNDFMKDLGIKSKVHFAGKDKSPTDIYGYSIMYASQHKNTWITLGGKRYELNPQPGSSWPIGIVKR